MRRTVALLAATSLSACYASHEPSAEGSAGGICRFTCADSSECGVNDRCTSDGLCERVGCESDADCPPGHVCARSGVRAEGLDCVPRCVDDSDCGFSGDWGTTRCVGGGCVWTGCPSDEWCTRIGRAAYRSPSSRHRCEPQPDGVAECRWICDSDAGCASDGYDALLVCRDGYCVFDACTSDGQCLEWWADWERDFRCVSRR